MRTERLVARTWRPEALGLACSLWGDERVTRLIRRGGMSRDEVEARLRRELRSQEVEGFQYWPFFLDGDFVGCCGLKRVSEPCNCVELGFHLRPEFWGRGLATEMARGALRRARELGLCRVYAGHHPGNAASRRLLEKLGFEFLQHSFFEPTGLMHPFYGLDLTRR